MLLLGHANLGANQSKGSKTGHQCNWTQPNLVRLVCCSCGNSTGHHCAMPGHCSGWHVFEHICSSIPGGRISRCDGWPWPQGLQVDWKWEVSICSNTKERTALALLPGPSAKVASMLLHDALSSTLDIWHSAENCHGWLTHQCHYCGRPMCLFLARITKLCDTYGMSHNIPHRFGLVTNQISVLIVYSGFRVDGTDPDLSFGWGR